MAGFFACTHRWVATAVIVALAAGAAPRPGAAQESPDPGSDNPEGTGGEASGSTDSGETRQDCYKDTLANFIYCWERRSPAERRPSGEALFPWQRRP